MSEEPRKRSRFDQAEPVVPRRSRFDQRERDRSRSPRRSVDPDNHRQRTRSPQASASPGAPLDAAAKIAEAKRRIDALAQAKQAPPPVDVPSIRSSTTPDKSRKLSVSVTSEIYTQDGDYIKDIEVNDLRNRYTLTKGATQKMIKELTGADVTTRGEYYPDKSMATPSAPPLYLHITSTSREGLEKAVQKIEEMMRQDLPNLVDERRFRRREPEPFERDEHGRRKWPEERLPIDMEPIPGFNLRAQVVGAGGAYVKHIQQETSCKVQIKGRHSGFIETATGMESDEPMFLHITGPQKEQVEKAKELCIDLLKSVKQNYDAFKERGPSRGHGRDRDGQYGHGNRHDNYGGYGGYQGYGGHQSPTNGRSSGYGGQTASSGSADATDYAQAWAQYYAQNPAADPYAAYGGYEAYVQMYSQWYTQQGASQSPVAGAAGTSAPPGPPAEQPPPPPPSDSAPPPPPPPGSAPSYNSVPPPPGM